MKRAKPRQWQDQYDVAAVILADEPGALEWATDDYVAFRYREPTVRIVFYPHCSTGGHYHIRIRDEGSKDKTRFYDLARRLRIGAGHSSTFTLKHAGGYPHEVGVRYGWAAEKALGRRWI